MLQIIALIKVKDRSSFEDFESRALKILRKNGGELIAAFEPNNEISSLRDYDEIHILQFKDPLDFDRYQKDKELEKIIDLKSAGTEMMDVIFSKKIVSY
jgi:uncharacterized protein (DUF1330 family)